MFCQVSDLTHVTEAKLRSNLYLTDQPPGICQISVLTAQRRLSEGAQP